MKSLPDTKVAQRLSSYLRRQTLFYFSSALCATLLLWFCCVAPAVMLCFFVSVSLRILPPATPFFFISGGVLDPQGREEPNQVEWQKNYKKWGRKKKGKQGGCEKALGKEREWDRSRKARTPSSPKLGLNWDGDSGICPVSHWSPVPSRLGHSFAF